jgi:hypothetical protein
VDQWRHLITDRVAELANEANDLQLDSPVTFEAMTDARLLQTSGGAAVVTDSTGNVVIYLDPSRATEYMVAHEIMHLVLHRSGWPQMWCIIPEGIDPLARRLADEVDSCFDHLKFDPRLETLGFDVKGYREWYLSAFLNWPSEKVTGPSVLWNALKIFDALLWGAHFRDRALGITSTKQPESSELARQLLHRANRAKAGTKSSVRLAMIEELDFLEEWVTERSGNVQNFRQRIGISPVFTKAQLRQSTSDTIRFDSHPLVINSHQLWLGGLVLKSDGIRLRNYACVEATSEPPEFNRIRQNLEELILKEFIEAEEIRKYGTLP